MNKEKLIEAIELASETGNLIGVGELTVTPQGEVIPFDSGLQGVVLSDKGQSSTKVEAQDERHTSQSSLIRSVNRKFTPIYQDNSLVISQGGRGSGKTKAAAWACILETFKPKRRNVLVLRFNMQTVKDSIYEDIIQELEQYNIDHHFEVKQRELINKLTGSAILFKGIKTGSRDVKDKLKGIPKLSYILIEEAADLNEHYEETLRLLQGSMRDEGYKYRIQIVLNPASKAHAIYQRHLASHPDSQPNGLVENVYFISSTYRDNKGLTQDYLDNIAAEKAYSPTSYAHVYGGEWLDTAKGQIITKFETGEFIDNGDVVMGIDWGFTDPTAAVLCTFDRKSMTAHVKLAYCETQLTEIDHCERLAPYRGMTIYTDNNRPDTITAIRDRGYNIRAADKPKVYESLTSMLDWNFIVDPDSPEIVEAFNKYEWNAKRANVPVHDHSHIPDAIRYAFVAVVGYNKGTYAIDGESYGDVHRGYTPSKDVASKYVKKKMSWKGSSNWH